MNYNMPFHGPAMRFMGCYAVNGPEKVPFGGRPLTDPNWDGNRWMKSLAMGPAENFAAAFRSDPWVCGSFGRCANLRQKDDFRKKISKCLQVGKICLPLHHDNTEHSVDRDGAIAQLVEQRTENPCVPGSIPGGTTLKRSKKLQNPDFQTKSGFSLFVGDAKNSGFRHLLVEQ